MKELNEEKESASEIIENLRNEIKLQAEHHTKLLAEQTEYHTQFAQNQLSDDDRIRELMAKLASDQLEI